jgi:hypothetical protein
MTIPRLNALAPTLALLFMAAADAAAQSPTVTATVNGAVVTVQWTPLPGATAYDVVVTGALSGSVAVPASVTTFTVTPPPGTYNVQIRGRAGTTVGPLSNLVTININPGGAPPGPCAPPAAPSINVSASGNLVTVSWAPVAGTIGYRVEFSRFPGGTELVQTLPANQTSIGGAVPLTGTFYVRVVAGNSCGTSPSQETSFTIGAPAPGPGPDPGQGPRTPNPPPGQLLPKPSYGESVVQNMARRYPGDLANACGSRTFLYRVVAELRKIDTRWALNYKRGQRGSLSTDIVTYNPTDRPDNGESQVYLFDIIGAICEGNYPAWGDSTPVTWQAGQARDPACGTPYCAWWTLDPYLAAGFPLYPQ